MIQKSIAVLTSIGMVVAIFGLVLPTLISSDNLPLWVIIPIVFVIGYMFLFLIPYGFYSILKCKKRKKK